MLVYKIIGIGMMIIGIAAVWRGEAAVKAARRAERRRLCRRRAWALSRRRKSAELRLAVRRSKAKPQIKLVVKNPEIEAAFKKIVN